MLTGCRAILLPFRRSRVALTRGSFSLHTGAMPRQATPRKIARNKTTRSKRVLAWPQWLASVFRPRFVSILVMAVRRTFADYAELREIAMSILERCGGDRQIILAVQRLMNSPENSLTYADALQELKALSGKCTRPED
jgi:hypothetical protein